MDRWEFCEVGNSHGAAAIRQLTEDRSGWIATEVAEPGANNMARALARLGKEGWEVVAIESTVESKFSGQTGPGMDSYTSHRCVSRAFLKRRVTE